MIWSDLIRDHAGSGLLVQGASPEVVARQVSRLAFLATPYRGAAVDAAGEWDYRLSYNAQFRPAFEALRLMQVGVTALSPVVLSVEMLHASCEGVQPVPAVDPFDEAIWWPWVLRMLDRCDAVVVPDVPGWAGSAGVLRCVRRALGRNVPVFVYAEGAA